MLTVAFVLFSLQVVSFTAHATPVHSDPELDVLGLHIPIRKRDPLSDANGIVDPNALGNSVLNTLSKYENGFQAYKRNTGQDHPLLADSMIFGLSEILAAQAASSSLLPNSIPTSSSSSSSTSSPSTKRAGTASEALTPLQSGALWQGLISVGTPAKSYTVDFDTGSSDLFLPGPTCTQNCNGHNIYNPASSKGAVDRRKTYTLAYGDGSSVKGEQWSDAVSISGLTATGQAIGASTTYSTGFSKSNFPPDGLMGMGYQSISAFNAPPFVQTLVAQGKVSKPVFAFKLSTASSGSELYLGGADSNLYTGSFVYAPVTVEGYWQVKMDSVSVTSGSGGSASQVGKNIQAIIDTGTTLVLGDSTTVKAFYASIPGSKDASSTYGQGYYTVPCNSVPTVSLTFAGKAFAISPKTFNLGQLSRISSDCVGGIVAVNGLGFWVVGDVFLQNVYTSFDLGGNQVGFANLK